MKKIIILLISCLFFVNCNHKEKAFSDDGEISNIPKEEQINIDEINESLSDRAYDTLMRSYFSNIADRYAYSKKFYRISKIIYIQSKKINDTVGMIKAKTNCGLHHLYNFSNDSSFYYFTQAEKLTLKTKGNPMLGLILQSKADLHWSHKDYSLSETTATRALKIAKKSGDNKLIYSCYITLANSLAGMDKNVTALDYYNKALIAVNQLKGIPQFSVLKAQTHNYIALIYQKQNQHKKVLDYLKSSIQLDQLKKEDVNMYLYVMNTIAYSKFKLKDNFSLSSLEETHRVADSISNFPIKITTKINLAEYYFTISDTSKALSYLRDAQIMAHENKIFEDELKALNLLSQIDTKNQSKYHKRIIKLTDSLNAIERETHDKYARIEFETDEITKQKEIVEEEKNNLFTRLILISGFGLLSIMLIVLWYKNQSQKAKTKQLLLEQEHQKDKEEIYQLMLAQQQKIEEGKQIEKRRISQELHDGVMGKLSSIRMNLYVLNKKTDPETIAQCLTYIKDIQHIEKEIRTISHELNSNLFSGNVNFVSIVENLFTAIKNHSDINFHLKVDEQIDWETVNNNIKINIYRIIQEALQNIDKYANAQNVFIKMVKTEANISIEIKDDGVGFDLKDKKTGIGLRNMQARMEEIKGKFSIESKPHNGTKINLIIPN
ncbi:MAG: sensor histidine kinase [Flavobacteriales bacterium]|nr:sensor histidine kinase [Flavobacteriales bacterium]